MADVITGSREYKVTVASLRCIIPILEEKTLETRANLGTKFYNSCGLSIEFQVCGLNLLILPIVLPFV